ncbi:taurine dioxygenase [Caballeronia arationis]|jgi:hypothetical protein|uniref:TauD/TfdA dioxygenase family protein n=1 Tax=Caballeronia arationis TaxID=1777142 RepID=UPI00074C9BBD|nr:TauD/TfdA family dioxygenase [Caballeronia arationis]SAK90473.1 taurine dioxygenase [Caballeronia arationis]
MHARRPNSGIVRIRGRAQKSGGLTATHDGDPTYRQRNRVRGIDDTGKRFHRALHPVVRAHPETGRKGIFVNSNFTTQIDDVSAAESEGILAVILVIGKQRERARKMSRYDCASTRPWRVERAEVELSGVWHRVG